MKFPTGDYLYLSIDFDITAFNNLCILIIFEKCFIKKYPSYGFNYRVLKLYFNQMNNS